MQLIDIDRQKIMSESQSKIYEAMLRRNFEEEFRTSRTVRVVPRIICYCVFCPIVILGFLFAGLTFDRHYRIAGLIGGEVGIVIGLLAWMLVLSWTKKMSYQDWKQSYEAKQAP